MIYIIINKALEHAEDLKKEMSSSQIFLQSLEILKPKKENFIRKLFFLIIEVIASIIMVKQSNTVTITKDVFQLVLTILVSLTAIVFTGYAFFQALINDELLVALLSADKEIGNLYGTNKYFAKIMIFQIVCILIDIFVVIFMMALPEEWYLFENSASNEYIATFLLSVILYSNIESVCEMKCFIFNVFQLFNLYAYSRMVIIKKNIEKEKD